MFFDGSLMKTGAGAGLLFISPLGKHLRYVLRLHFPASNNVAEYEALVNGLRITIELGVRRLDARGDSQLVIDQVMKNSHCRDPKMEAYCDEVRFPRTSSPETCINPPSRSTTRPSPRRPQPSPRYPRLSPRHLRHGPRHPQPSPSHPRFGPKHPRHPRVRHCVSRRSEAGSCLIKTGRPRTCNISTEESYPSTEPRLGGWRGAPSRSSCWEMGRSSTTAAPQASSSDASPSPKIRNSYEIYTRGLAAITQHLEPLSEMLSGKVSTGRRRWSTPLELSAPAKGVSSTQGRPTCLLRLCRPYPSPG
jgi:hypothetical protein